jgi:hypothetical protein
MAPNSPAPVRVAADDPAGPVSRRAPRLLLLILAVAGAARFYRLDYATAFVDEGSFVQVGRAILENPLKTPYSEPLQYMFGWYLWPALAAMGDALGGIAGVRGVAAGFGTLTVLAMYLFARRVFGEEAGLASAALLAVSGPAVNVSQFGSYDAAAICFMALGLWLYARGWQSNGRLAWLSAGACFFLSFLAKYFVALYFPLLVLAALARGKRPLVWFSLPLAIYCGAFLFLFWEDMSGLIGFGRRHIELTAPAGQLFQIYFTSRAEFWLMFALALCAWPASRAERWAIPLLWIGAGVMAAFQWWSRADYNTWKHVNYSLLFLVPLGVAGMWRLVRLLPARHFRPAALAGVLLVAAPLAWAGNVFRPERFVFWPDVRPILDFMQPRLKPETRVLADDLTFQYYYFDKSLAARQTAHPYYLRYRGATGGAAYALAVRDGAFDYIVLDGWAAPASVAMRNAVRPALAELYESRLSAPARQMGGRLEVFERARPGRFDALLAALRGRLNKDSWVLAENEDLRLWLRAQVSPGRFFDPENLRYGGFQRGEAQAQAVQDGMFDFVILGGGVLESAAAMRASVLPVLVSRYSLREQFEDAVSQSRIEIYERSQAAEGAPRIEILGPKSAGVVASEKEEATLKVAFAGAQAGWQVNTDIYTNRWYRQGEQRLREPSGVIPQTIYLGSPCGHLIRVRLYDETGKLRASAASFGVRRANPDGSAPRCPED